MNFNEHSDLDGCHAFLGASQYHWINYDEEKLVETYLKRMAVLKGTRLHNFAKECIELGERLPKSQKTLNMYVNDAIGFRMKPEQVLYYSPNCFGTADAISFAEKKRFLRIHDLKTGVTPASMKQLHIYTSLFCLEYDVNPNDIEIELRIYQNNEITVDHPYKEDILYIMDKIKKFDDRITRLRMEEQ